MFDIYQSRKVALWAAITFLCLLDRGSNASQAGAVDIDYAASFITRRLHQRYIVQYQHQKPNVHFRLQNANETSALSLTSSSRVLFGAVQTPPNNPWPLLSIPLAIAPLVPIYNIPSLPNEHQLIMTWELLVGIFNGQVTNLQHTLFSQANPGIIFPNEPISVFYYMGESPSTLRWTQALSTMASAVGASWISAPSASYPTIPGLIATRDTFSAISDVAATSNSFSYASISLIGATESHYAMLKKASVSADNLNATLRRMASSNPTRRTIEVADDAWPIASIEFVLFHETIPNGESCSRQENVVKYLRWLAVSLSSLPLIQLQGFIPLPAPYVDNAVAILEQLKCPRSDVPILAVSKILQHDGIWYTFILGLAILAIFTSIAFGAVLLYFPQAASSRVLTSIHLLGAIISFVGMIWWYILPTEDWVCGLRTWFIFLGLSIQFSAIFTKTWLYFRIFESMNTKNGRKISNFHIRQNITIPLTLCIFTQVILLLVWSLSDPMVATSIEVNIIDRLYSSNCACQYPIVWIILEAIYLVCINFWGLFVVYKTWTIKEALYESRWILMSVYNNLVSIGVVIALIALRSDEDFLFFVFTVPVLFVGLFMTISLTLPKIIEIVKYRCKPTGIFAIESLIAKRVDNGDDMHLELFGIRDDSLDVDINLRSPKHSSDTNMCMCSFTIVCDTPSYRADPSASTNNSSPNTIIDSQHQEEPGNSQNLDENRESISTLKSIPNDRFEGISVPHVQNKRTGSRVKMVKDVNGYETGIIVADEFAISTDYDVSLDDSSQESTGRGAKIRTQGNGNESFEERLPSTANPSSVGTEQSENQSNESCTKQGPSYILNDSSSESDVVHESEHDDKSSSSNHDDTGVESTFMLNSTHRGYLGASDLDSGEIQLSTEPGYLELRDKFTSQNSSRTLQSLEAETSDHDSSGNLNDLFQRAFHTGNRNLKSQYSTTTLSDSDGNYLKNYLVVDEEIESGLNNSCEESGSLKDSSINGENLYLAEESDGEEPDFEMEDVVSDTAPPHLDSSGLAKIDQENLDDLSVTDTEERSSVSETKTKILNMQFSMTRDFNKEFQSLLDLPDSIAKFKQLRQLSADFSYTAKTYGRIIISELYLSPEMRTIQPLSMGGVAGGEKYLVSGILFKFAVCTTPLMLELYGGDEWSFKSFNAEMRGISCIYDCRVPAIRVPLMSLIDYMSVTLKYGSADAAVTVCHSDTKLNRKIKTICEILNLKGHHVGRTEPHLIYGPVDIEGHKGSDGEFYIVDAARLHPPQAPYLPPEKKPLRPGLHLWRFLRPEFVMKYRKPLSSDAFSSFYHSKYRSERKNDSFEVQEATQYLFDAVLPEYVERVIAFALNSSTLKELNMLFHSHPLHHQGINLRHMGRIRALLMVRAKGNPVLELAATALLVEIVARVLKNLIRWKLREKMMIIKTAAQEAYIEIITEFLNIVLGNHPQLQTTQFWTKEIKPEIQSRFEQALSEKELSSKVNLLDLLRPHLVLLLKRFSKHVCIFLTDAAWKEFKSTQSLFVVLPTDIAEMAPAVKQLNIIFKAQGAYLLLLAGQTRSPAEVERLVKLANDSFKEAIVSTTNPYSTLVQHAGLLLAVIRNQAQMVLARKMEILNLVCNLYRAALEAIPRNPLACRQLGFALGLWAAYTTSEEKKRIHLEEAASLFTLAYDVDVTSIEKITYSLLKRQGTQLVVLLRIFSQMARGEMRKISQTPSDPLLSGLGSSNQGASFTENLSVLAPAVFEHPRHNPMLGLSSPAVSLGAAFIPDVVDQIEKSPAQANTRNAHGPKGMPARAVDVLLARVWKNLASPFAGVQLNLSDNCMDILTDDCIALILPVYVINLKLNGARLLTDRSLNAIGEHCQVLEKLSLKGTNFDPRTLKLAIGPIGHRLKKLTVPDNPALLKVIKKIAPNAMIKVEKKDREVPQAPVSNMALGVDHRVENALMNMMAQKHFSNQVDPNSLEWRELIPPQTLSIPATYLLMSITDTDTKSRLERLMAFSIRPSSELAPNLVKVLASLLDDPEAKVRVWTVICLSRFGSGAAFKAIVQKSKRETNSEVKEAMSHAVARHSASIAGIFIDNRKMKLPKRSKHSPSTASRLSSSFSTSSRHLLSSNNSSASLMKTGSTKQNEDE